MEHLPWSTGYDSADDLGLDGAGNIYVAGSSVTMWGTPVRAHGPGSDAFVAKLDPSGNLLWNTFLGAGGVDQALSLTVQSDGTCYAAGLSNATWGAPLRAFTAGQGDAFAAGVGTNGNLLWNTFLGGTGSDEGRAIAIDPEGGLFVAGLSDAAWGAPARAYSADSDGFLARLDLSGNLSWNTFFGGAGADIIDELADHQGGGVYVSGWSSASWGAPVRAFAGGRSDALVARVEADAGLVWNTFLGGDGGASFDDDYGNSLVTAPNGDVYVTGDSESSWGTPVSSPAGGHDVFVALLDDPATCVPIAAPTAHNLEVGLGCESIPGGLGAGAGLLLLAMRGVRRRKRYCSIGN